MLDAPTHAKRGKILHIVESYGGGVSTTITRYVKNTPEFEHHLLANIRSGAFSDAGESSVFRSVRTLSPRLATAWTQIRETVRDVQPSVIHAHSSFGGAYARLAIRARRDLPVVYTPHGYGFERRDVGWGRRAMYWLTEFVLSINTSTVAGCAPREVSLARRMFARRVVYVPNVASVEDEYEGRREQRTIVAAGRITAARDPFFFAEFARKLRVLVPDARIVWVGGGADRAAEHALHQQGVEVTGWISQPEATRRVAQSTVFVHTAAWDGFPMSVLEANRSGIPVVVRRSAALADAPHAVSSPEDMAEKVARAITDVEYARMLRADWAEYLRLNVDEVQHRRLMEAYGGSCGDEAPTYAVSRRSSDVTRQAWTDDGRVAAGRNASQREAAHPGQSHSFVDSTGARSLS